MEAAEGHQCHLLDDDLVAEKQIKNHRKKKKVKKMELLLSYMIWYIQEDVTRNRNNLSFAKKFPFFLGFRSCG